MGRHEELQRVIDAYDGDVAGLIRDLQSRQTNTPQTPRPHRDLGPVIVDVASLGKTYKLGKTTVEAVKDVSLQVSEGEIVALVGTSGSGKSTVLNLIGGLDKPTKGTVRIDGTDLKSLRDGALSKYRGQKIGFVFQFFYLQPFLTLRDNVELPGMFSRTKRALRHPAAGQHIASVGLSDRAAHYPKELSGGQMQRAAIARALMNNPRLLLADEPTGNLDHENALAIFELFEKIRTELGTTIIVVTHDEELASRADRIVRLRDGVVV